MAFVDELMIRLEAVDQAARNTDKGKAYEDLGAFLFAAIAGVKVIARNRVDS